MFNKIKNVGSLTSLLRSNLTLLFIICLALASFLLTYRLASLTAGLSVAERVLAEQPIGWHGLALNPLFLPLKVLWSAGYLLFGQGGALVSRLAPAVFGILAIVAVSLILRAWHNTRIAILGTILFATSAWTLHVSRYAGFESTYLTALPLLLLSQIALTRIKNSWIIYPVLLLWSILLFTPGLVWFVLLAAIWQRKELVASWKSTQRWWQRVLILLSGLIWMPILGTAFYFHHQLLTSWLGLPTEFGSLQQFGHRLAAVPVHVFIHGPGISDLWLGQLPIFGIFSLTMVVLGFTFYARRWRSGRSHLLAAYGVLATVVIALGGPASLSLIIPLIYLIAAAGTGWLLNEWLKYFPNNPIARAIGISFIAFAVVTSSAYNLQSYFVAWPHNAATIREFGHKS